MSVVTSAIKDFNTNFKRIFGYIGQVDVEVGNGTNYQELAEFSSLSREEKEALAEGEKADEPIDYKKMLQFDDKKNKKIEEVSKVEKDEKNDRKRKLTTSKDKSRT